MAKENDDKFNIFFCKALTFGQDFIFVLLFGLIDFCLF